MNVSKKQLEELSRDFADGKLVPLLGAGVNAKTWIVGKELPSWEKLVIGMATKMGKLKDVRPFLKYKDYISALSLLAAEGKKYQAYLDSLLRTSCKDVIDSDLLFYQRFYKIKWPLVCTLNVDTLAEKLSDHITIGTQSSDAESVVHDVVRGNRESRHLLYLHGCLDSAHGAPLLTWTEYFSGYGVDTAISNRLFEQLTQGSKDTSYKKALAQLFTEAKAPQSCEGGAGFARVTSIWKTLFGSYSILAIGTSLTEPVWSVLSAVWSEINPHRKTRKIYWVSSKEPPSSLGGLNIEHLRLAWTELGEFLDTLAQNFKLSLGSGAEGRRRLENYRPLFDQSTSQMQITPALQWLYKSGVKRLPIVQRWINYKNDLDAVRIKRAVRSEFRPNDPAYSTLRDKYWIYRQSKSKGRALTNEWKPRITSIEVDGENNLHLAISPVSYKDFVATTHFASTIDAQELEKIETEDPRLAKMLSKFYRVKGQFDPWGYFAATSNNFEFSSTNNASCDIGANIFVLGYSDARGIPVIPCSRSNRQLTSPGELVETASGSMDWPLAVNSKNDGDLEANPGSVVKQFCVREEALRELTEEWLMGEEKFDRHSADDRRKFEGKKQWLKKKWISKIVPVGLFQNIERVGKPELVVLITLKSEDRTVLEFINCRKANWELSKVHPAFESISGKNLFSELPNPYSEEMVLLPSPITPKFTRWKKTDDAMKFCERIASSSKYHPGFRGSLKVFLNYCREILKNPTEQK